MSGFDSDDAELAKCVRQLLEVDDEHGGAQWVERPSHHETAATLPSFAAVSEVAPEDLPPAASSRTTIEPDAGRYSLISVRRARE